MRATVLILVALSVGGCSSGDRASPPPSTTTTTELPRALPQLVPAARAVLERVGDAIEDRDAQLRACILLTRAAADAESGTAREGLTDDEVAALRRAAELCRTDPRAAAAELARIDARPEQPG